MLDYNEYIDYNDKIDIYLSQYNNIYLEILHFLF